MSSPPPSRMPFSASVTPPLVPTLTGVPSGSDQMTFRFETEFGASYQPEASTNLTEWLDIGTPLSGNGEVLTVSTPTTSSNRLSLRLKTFWQHL